MAGFKTHIGVSTTLGVAYGAAGYWYGVPLNEAILSGTLFSIAGMLPDLDSGTGVPFREISCFFSALVPLMVVERLRPLNLQEETLLAIAILGYIVMRFGVMALFRRYTVHRGMWHSLPAAAIAGLSVYLLTCRPEEWLRIYRSAAVVGGFLCHLVLDELWSLEIKRGKLRIKRSLGTALKLWSRHPWANLSTYAKLAALVALVVFNPPWLHVVHMKDHHEKGSGVEQRQGETTPAKDPLTRQARQLEKWLESTRR